MTPKRSSQPRSLSDSEWAIMKVIWDHGPMALRDVCAKLAAQQRWAYSTVKTLVRRMVAKGWLDYQRVGNSFLYKAAVAKRQATRAAVRDFAERVLDGLLSPFVAYYAEERGLSPQDIDQLEQIVRKHRKR